MKKKIPAALLCLIIAACFGFFQPSAKAANSNSGWTYINNSWYYFDSGGTKAANKWVQDSSKRWFYLGSDGAMVKNTWAQDGSKKWFYLGSDGAMKTSCWIKDNGKWYYLNADGSKAVNAWAQDSSKKWFYLGSDGAMKTSSWVSDKGNWYYLNADGSKAVNTWAQDSSKKWFYLGPDGAMKTSCWLSDKGKWYYLNADGSMAANTTTPDGYHVDANGVWDGKGQVSAKDTTPPVITLKGDSSVTIYTGSAYSDAGASVTDNKDTGLAAFLTITDSSGVVVSKIDTSKAGTFKITYSAADSAGNKAAPVVRTVVVQEKAPVKDTVAPVITLNGSSTQRVLVGKAYADPGVSVTDNKDTGLTASVKITNSAGTAVSKIDTSKAGTFKITYSAADSAGNKAVPVVRTVVVDADKTPPVIALNGYETQYVKNGLIYVDAGASATDDTDGTVAVTKEIKDPKGNTVSKIDTTAAGKYTVTYTALDSSGNKTQISRTVIVKEAGAPISFAIDIGHNAAYDGGATGIRKEDDCTMEVGTLVKQKLKDLKYDVVDCYPSNPVNTTDALKQRVDRANASAADYFVSIHFNSSGNGTGHGSEVYYFSGSDVGCILAANVENELTALGYTNRGVKTAGFYVIKYSNMPAILIECSFVDSPVDMAMYNPESLASAIVRGLTKLP